MGDMSLARHQNMDQECLSMLCWAALGGGLAGLGSCPRRLVPAQMIQSCVNIEVWQSRPCAVLPFVLFAFLHS